MGMTFSLRLQITDRHDDFRRGVRSCACRKHTRRDNKQCEPPSHLAGLLKGVAFVNNAASSSSVL
jgi:hypothetical protein